MEERYLTLKLTVSELRKERYRSRIDSSPMGASDGSGSDFPLSAAQVKEWAAQAPGGEAPTRNVLETVGKNLFGLIFKGHVREKYRECVVAAQERNARLRIGLAVLPSSLTAVPWEYLHDGHSFLIKAGHLIVRLIDTLPEKPAYFQPIRRLLVVIANPTKEPELYHPFEADVHREELMHSLGPITAKVLMNRGKDELMNALRDTESDALYFVGHGRYGETLGGQLVLVDPDGAPVYFDAETLAGAVRESKIRFVYLNSCSTAATGLTTPFSGVAQQLMLNGNVDAVVAMQTPVTQRAGLKIAQGFFDEVWRGSSPELALARARISADDNFYSWGIPVIYTYLGGSDDLVRNQIACLISAEIGKSRYGMILPAFGMGLHLDGVGEVDVKQGGTYVFPANPGPITVKVEPPPPMTFVFPGDTHAREDVESVVDVFGLLSRIADPAEISILDSTDQRSDVTHWFLFGSRSNKIVASLLTNYSERFRFDYGKKWPGKWSLEEVSAEGNEPVVHSVDAPSGLGKLEYAEREDFGIIEKIVDPPSNRVFFIIAGLGSRATRGCGWWLAMNWGELVREFGAQGFGIVLRFPGGQGMTFDHARRVDRQTTAALAQTQNAGEKPSA